jgi:hypothetical protein
MDIKKVGLLMFLSLIIFSGCSSTSEFDFREELVEYTTQFEKVFLELNQNSDDVLVVTDFVKNRFSEKNTEIEEVLLDKGHSKEGFEYHGNGNFWRSQKYDLDEGIISISFYNDGNLERIEEKYDGVNYYKYYNEKGTLIYKFDGSVQYSYYDDGSIRTMRYDDNREVRFDSEGREIYRSYKDKSWVKYEYYILDDITYRNFESSWGSWSKYKYSSVGDRKYSAFNFNRYAQTLSLSSWTYSKVKSLYNNEQMLMTKDKENKLYSVYTGKEILYYNSKYSLIDRDSYNNLSKTFFVEAIEKSDSFEVTETQLFNIFENFKEGISNNKNQTK